jgi:hypothetical protein
MKLALYGIPSPGWLSRLLAMRFKSFCTIAAGKDTEVYFEFILPSGLKRGIRPHDVVD